MAEATRKREEVDVSAEPPVSPRHRLSSGTLVLTVAGPRGPQPQGFSGGGARRADAAFRDRPPRSRFALTSWPWARLLGRPTSDGPQEV